MPTCNRWSEYTADRFRRRLDWADQAYDDFRAALPAEVSDSLSGKRSDSNIALYGPPQVGKTILLLTLLGVREDRILEVGGILRGGRPQGKSATATAMTYRASDGDHWTWRELPAMRLKEPRRLDANGISRELADLRTKVEHGQWGVENTIDVGLPVGCFAIGAGFNVKVLDLPGVAGRDPGERRHAEKLIQDRIAVMDMVLLTGKVSELGFLHPHALGTDSLRNWVHLPGRFAVVTTHTYSNASVQEWLTAGSVTSLDQLKVKLAAEIRTHDIPMPQAADGRWLYPLEFGESWEKTGKSLALSRDLRDACLRDISSAMERGSAPEARIRHAFQVAEVAKHVRKRREQELDGRVALAQAAQKQAKHRFEAAERAVQKHRSLLPDVRGLQAKIDGIKVAARTEPLATVDAIWTFEGRQTDPVDVIAMGLGASFKRAVADWMRHEAATRLAMPPSVANAVGASDREAAAMIAKADAALSARFDAIRAWIDRKFSPIRLPMWRRNREEVTAMVRAAHQALLEELRQYLVEHAERRARVFNDRLRDYWQAQERTTRALEAEAGREKRALEQEGNAVTRVTGERQKILAELDAAKATATTFPGRLHRQYEETRLARLRELALASDDLARLSIAVAVIDQAKLYDSIQSGA